jgi:heme/copper-type cytochrome/quinol oxidase subunit 2
MNSINNLKFSSNNYQKWYGENDVMQNLATGLTLGIVLYFFIALFVFKMYSVLDFGVSFYDPSSAFAEHLIHLYNIVWIILIFVVFFILVLLIRIVYLFNWNFIYFSSNLYLSFVTISLEYVLALSFLLNDESLTNSLLKRLNLLKTSTSGLDTVGLNIWYNNDSRAFLTVSEISEYRVLEVVWCLLPIGSLLMISTPTFSLIFSLDACVDPAYTIKIIGRQWYWTYSIDAIIDNLTEANDESDENVAKLIEKQVSYVSVKDYNKYNLYVSNMSLPVSLEFDSNLVSEDDLIKGTHRLLEVDNRLFLPVGIPIRLLITSSDVLHSWAVPNLGIKVDAVPGRLNQFIVEIKRPGVFYGQCSELCGPFHGFMPIVIQAVSLDKFEDWMINKSNNG